MPLVGSGPIKPALPEWEAGEVKVTKEHSRTDIPAMLLGELFAVHESVEPDSEKWTVTHQHTGLRIVEVDTSDDATEIAEVLYEFKEQFHQTSKKEMRALLPIWVSEWLKYCRDKGTYVSPKNFRS